MADSRRDDVDEFFDRMNLDDWGRLLAVKCQPQDLIDYRQNDIPETLNRVIQQPDWQMENSSDWALKNSGEDCFYIFKVHALWKSIRFNGVKSPIHVHAAADEEWLEFHPSRNKIEVLCEYFPNMEVTALYHDYRLLSNNYPRDVLSWYNQHKYTMITNSEDYYKLYNLDHDDPHLLLSFGWDWCKNIIADPDGVWGKVKPRARDWRRVKPVEHQGDSDWENALFLSVTDRYHRVSMEKQGILLKDIIQTKPGQAKFCGKWYEIE